jgi:hypothetical protein
MKISISGPARAFDRSTESEITDPHRLRTLNGVTSEDPRDLISTYFDDDLADLGVIGGSLRLQFEQQTGTLRVVSDFWAPRRLRRDELALLVAETKGQWSDGIGEGSWCDKVIPNANVSVDVSSSGDGKVKVEQTDDGRPVALPALLPKAAKSGDLKAIREALAVGEDINALSIQRFTPLSLAIRYQHVEAAILLVNQGADVDLRCWEHTPLMDCALTRDLSDEDASKIACALLERGANVNAPSGTDDNALSYAENRDKKQLQALLVKWGAKMPPSPD